MEKSVRTNRNTGDVSSAFQVDALAADVMEWIVHHTNYRVTCPLAALV